MTAPRRALPGWARRSATPADGAARAPWGWALLGALLGTALVLAWAAPARWVAAAVLSASGERVVLAEPQGSVWSGSARLLLAGGAGSHDRVALPGRVHWQLRPALAGLKLRLNADCCTPEGALALAVQPRWGGARLALADGRSRWPADLLTGLGTPWNTLRPQGELSVQTRGLAVSWLAGRASVAGSAELTAANIASRVSPVRPLGTYRVLLSGGDAVRLALSTVEGGLLLSGTGQWIGPRLRLTGEARAAPELQDQLANLLNLIGRRSGDRAIISIG